MLKMGRSTMYAGPETRESLGRVFVELRVRRSLATAEEIGTWIDALERRVVEIGKELGEIHAEIRDDELPVLEQNMLHDRLVRLKEIIRDVGKP